MEGFRNFRNLSFFFISLICRAPFDVSLTVLTVMSIIVVYTWPENYGNQSANIQESMTNALRAIKDGMYVILFSSEFQTYSGSSKTNITDLCMLIRSQSYLEVSFSTRYQAFRSI